MAISNGQPKEGMLVAHGSIKDPRMTEEHLVNWYNEHGPDVVGCKGINGCMYHYLNTDASIKPNQDLGPNYANRIASPETSIDDIAAADWPSLAIVKVGDINWVLSQEFADIPRKSKELPRNEDGSMGSAFTVLHYGLRTYEIIGRQVIVKANGSNEQPTDLLMIQVADTDDATFEELESVVRSNVPTLYDSVRLKLMDGLLPYQEPGKLPQGLALFRFNGGVAAPKSLVSNIKGVVKVDTWRYRTGWNDTKYNL